MNSKQTWDDFTSNNNGHQEKTFIFCTPTKFSTTLLPPSCHLQARYPQKKTWLGSVSFQMIRGFLWSKQQNHRVSPSLPDYPGLQGTSNFLSFADKSRSTLSVALKYLGAAVSWRSGESQAARPHIPPCSEKLCFRSNTPSCLVSKACCSKAAPPKKKGNTFVLLFMGVKGPKIPSLFPGTTQIRQWRSLDSFRSATWGLNLFFRGFFPLLQLEKQ